MPEDIKQLIRKVGLSNEVVKAASSDLRRSTACLCQGEVVQIPPFMSWKEYCFVEGHSTSLGRNLCVSAKEAESVSLIKQYRSSLNHGFIVSGMNLAVE